jgi:hypothetical protein
MISKHKVGDIVVLHVIRDGDYLEMAVELAPWDDEKLGMPGGAVEMIEEAEIKELKDAFKEPKFFEGEMKFDKEHNIWVAPKVEFFGGKEMKDGEFQFKVMTPEGLKELKSLEELKGLKQLENFDFKFETPDAPKVRVFPPAAPNVEKMKEVEVMMKKLDVQMRELEIMLKKLFEQQAKLREQLEEMNEIEF